jgi:hypothetical protein
MPCDYFYPTGFVCVPTDQPSYGCAAGASTCAPCVVANAIAACAGGACAVGQCQTDFADCNQNPADGCEVNLRTSNSHCGTCGNACPGGTSCFDGSCLAAGGPPLSNCSGTWVNLVTSISNCGGCGKACTPGAGQIATCAGGSCVYNAACPAGLSTCGSDCVDTSADPLNCGSCAHACPRQTNGAALCVNGQCACPTGLTPDASGACVDTMRSTAACGGIAAPPCTTGQMCSNGVCVAAPTLVTGVTVSDMVVDGAWIYFVDSAGGTVNAVPTGGGAPVALATGQAKPLHLAVDGQYVYYSANLGGAVMRVPEAGGTPTVVAATTEPTHLVVDNQNVYWLDGADSNLQSAPKGGGAATVVATGVVSAATGAYSPLYQNQQSLFYVGGKYNAQVMSVAKAGPSAPSVLVDCTPMAGSVSWFAVDESDTYYYYVCDDPQPLFAVPFAGGSAIEVWPTLIDRQVADAAGIYSVVITGNGSAAPLYGIAKLNYCRNTSEALLLGLTGIQPTLLALDPTYVYWSDGTQIGRVAK